MKKLTTKDFIEKSIKIHGEKYDYSLVKYENSLTKVKISCPSHGVFEQEANSHLRGIECYHCGKLKMIKKLIYNNTEYIKKAEKIHVKKYDYSLVNYVGCNNKIIIICPKHREFNQTPTNHLNGSGCPLCKTSKGELIVKNFLDTQKIEYVSQKTFTECRDKGLLKFDFYLPKYNLCIEYDGIQHYEVNNRFGGVTEFDEIKKRDEIKNKFCRNNGIKLIRIPYNIKINLENLLNFI